MCVKSKQFRCFSKSRQELIVIREEIKSYFFFHQVKDQEGETNLEFDVKKNIQTKASQRLSDRLV